MPQIQGIRPLSQPAKGTIVRRPFIDNGIAARGEQQGGTSHELHRAQDRERFTVGGVNQTEEEMTAAPRREAVFLASMLVSLSK